MPNHVHGIIIIDKTPVETQDFASLHPPFSRQDDISLTDMANAKESASRAADIIKNWMRTRYTLEFLGTWEAYPQPQF
jgi:hypothetical protein